MGIKLFASADLHLGMKFARYSEDVRNALVKARMEALSRMIDAANRASCDLFILAGDLFDRPNCPKAAVLEALKHLDRFEGSLVALLPGNHDYVASGTDGLWAFLSREAGDRVLLLTEGRPYDLAGFDLDAVLYPAPCTEKHSAAGADRWVASAEKRPDRAHHIGLAHGSVEGVSPDFDGRYYPMTRSGLERSGVDLWIVGHTHGQWSEGKIFIPGTPEPDGFDCSHGGSAFIITLGNDGKVEAEPVSTGAFRFIDTSLTVRLGMDPSGDIAALLPDDRSKTLLRLSLQGLISPENLDSLTAFLKTLEGELFYLLPETDGLAREITRDEIDGTFSENSFPHMLLQSLAEAEDPVLLNLAWSLVREASE